MSLRLEQVIVIGLAWCKFSLVRILINTPHQILGGNCPPPYYVTAMMPCRVLSTFYASFVAVWRGLYGRDRRVCINLRASDTHELRLSIHIGRLRFEVAGVLALSVWSSKSVLYHIILSYTTRSGNISH